MQSEPTKKSVGRPRTGVTKEKPGITLDRKLVAKARKAARRRGSSFSAYVEDAIRENLARVAEDAP